MDWRKSIVELTLIKQSIDEADAKRLWEYHLPGVANTEAELQGVERSLQESLDPDHRAFLKAAGGWPAFYQTVDLFGAKDFAGERYQRAEEMLSYVEDNIFDKIGFSREQVYPIAASPVDLDLFVITRRATASPGMVIWLAGYEVDRFATFGDFFASMVAYNRRELEHLRSS
jgi:hypothetical protein